MPEVWAQSVQLASTNAVSLGFTHIQWLAGEKIPETVHHASPIECSRGWGRRVHCSGGEGYDVPVAMLATGHFVYLSGEEAKQREADPLIPAERRPIDARRAVGERGNTR